MRSSGVSVGCLVTVLLAGCCSHPVKDAKKPEAGQQLAAIEARAALVFSNAVLLKPPEAITVKDLAFVLAPLLVQEVAGSDKGSRRGPATIYHQLGAVQVAGMTRPQMTYLWSCGKKLTRGVRLTLDLQGLPVIWEVLDDYPGPRVVFVSRSLEERAKMTFELPAPGRRFAVEQPLNVVPDVVVARVLEDGPVAMGPIVHETINGEINAVICRCMPTQARQLVATTYYELKPLSDAKNVNFEIVGTNRALTEMLRLPAHF